MHLGNIGFSKQTNTKSWKKNWQKKVELNIQNMNLHYKIIKNTITSLMKHKTNKNEKMHIKVRWKTCNCNLHTIHTLISNFPCNINLVSHHSIIAAITYLLSLQQNVSLVHYMISLDLTK